VVLDVSALSSRVVLDSPSRCLEGFPNSDVDVFVAAVDTRVSGDRESFPWDVEFELDLEQFTLPTAPVRRVYDNAASVNAIVDCVERCDSFPNHLLGS
jgi:hypothetical protein